MKVWLFDIMMWPNATSAQRTQYPFPGRYYDRELGATFFQEHLEYLVRAEALGFDAVGFAEHHYGTNGLCPSPNLMAAAVAARTSTIKLALMGNCLPIHGHPVRLAEELAMLDAVSGGRVISGFIRGGFLEYYAFSVELAESRGRFEESWELIEKAWTAEDPFEWRGEYYNYDAVSILPRPVQRPHPPLIMAANTRESVEWAARKRVPLAVSFGPTEALKRTLDYYREFAERECGWTPGPEHCLVSRQVYVAETREKAREQVEEHVMNFFSESPVIRPYTGKLEEYRLAMQSARNVDYKNGQSRPPAHQPPSQPDLDYYQQQGFCIVGDPDFVFEQIRHQQDVLGVGTFLAYAPFGTMQVPQASRSAELFAKEVLPALREAQPTRTPAAVGAGSLEH